MVLREEADIGGALSGRPGPGTRQKPLQFSILDRVCGGQAGCAGQTSKPPTVGSALIAAHRTPAPRGWLSPSPAAPAPVLRLLLPAAEPAITPEPHNRCVLFMETQEVSLVASENHCLWLDLVRTWASCKQLSVSLEELGLCGAALHAPLSLRVTQASWLCLLLFWR